MDSPHCASTYRKNKNVFLCTDASGTQGGWLGMQRIGGVLALTCHLNQSKSCEARIQGQIALMPLVLGVS